MLSICESTYSFDIFSIIIVFTFTDQTAYMSVIAFSSTVAIIFLVELVASCIRFVNI